MRYFFPLVMLTVPLFAANKPVTVFPGNDWETASPAAMGVDSAGLEAAMAVINAITGEDGNTQAMVVRHGRVIWQGSNTNSWHNVFSCCKSFTSMVAGLLAGDGKLTADTKLAGLLPALGEQYPEMTVGTCLSLTSGYRPADGQQEFVPGPPLFREGGAFIYNGKAFEVLGLALTVAAGRPLDELFMERIGGPAGFSKHFQWGDHGHVDGYRVNGGSGGSFKGIHTTARNIARAGLLLLNNGNWNGTQLLPAGWIAEASRPQAPATLPLYNEDGWYKVIHGAYGYGFWVNGIRDDGTRPWPDAPEGTFALQGNMNNICFILPDWDMVVVRLGTDRAINCDRYNEVFAELKKALDPRN